MTTAFITRDFTGQPPNLAPGGCAYYRCYLPMSALANGSLLGLPAWDPIRGFGIKENERQAIFGFKTVMLKLIMDRATPRQVELAQALGQRIYVDLDDYYHGLTPANRAYTDTHPDENKRTNRDYYEQIIQSCDTLTVSTPFLLDFYSKQRDNVVMVRNAVNTFQFTPRKHHERKPVIGWAGATAYRNSDLEILNDWLPDFLEEHDLTFHHAGATSSQPPITDHLHINPKRLRTTPLVPITHYAAGLNFDIGLVPLNNIPFNEAKSNIKGLEYAAAGIPFIASDLPEYRLLHEDGVGRIANTPEEWRSHAEALLDYSIRRKEAKRSSDIVSGRWSIETRAEEWRRVFAD